MIFAVSWHHVPCTVDRGARCSVLSINSQPIHCSKTRLLISGTSPCVPVSQLCYLAVPRMLPDSRAEQPGPDLRMMR